MSFNTSFIKVNRFVNGEYIIAYSNRTLYFLDCNLAQISVLRVATRSLNVQSIFNIFLRISLGFKAIRSVNFETFINTIPQFVCI